MQGLPHLIELPPAAERDAEHDGLLPRLLHPTDGFRAWRELALGYGDHASVHAADVSRAGTAARP